MCLGRKQQSEPGTEMIPMTNKAYHGIQNPTWHAKPTAIKGFEDFKI